MKRKSQSFEKRIDDPLLPLFYSFKRERLIGVASDLGCCDGIAIPRFSNPKMHEMQCSTMPVLRGRKPHVKAWGMLVEMLRYLVLPGSVENRKSFTCQAPAIGNNQGLNLIWGGDERRE